MGLDFDKSDARWSYGCFMRFRTDLALLIGIVLDDMQGFGGAKEWPAEKDEPLVGLLNHSDCDGELTAKQCAAIGPRLREVAPKLPSEYDRDTAERLAEDLIACGKKRQKMVFC